MLKANSAGANRRIGNGGLGTMRSGRSSWGRGASRRSCWPRRLIAAPTADAALPIGKLTAVFRRGDGGGRQPRRRARL